MVKLDMVVSLANAMGTLYYTQIWSKLTKYGLVAEFSSLILLLRTTMDDDGVISNLKICLYLGLPDYFDDFCVAMDVFDGILLLNFDFIFTFTFSSQSFLEFFVVCYCFVFAGRSKLN